MSRVTIGSRAAPAARAPLWWAAAALLFGAAFGTNVVHRAAVAVPVAPAPQRHRRERDLRGVRARARAVAAARRPGVGPLRPAARAGAGGRADRRRVADLPARCGLDARCSTPPGSCRGWRPAPRSASAAPGCRTSSAPRSPPAAARRASLALNAGFCLGPLTSGLLGQYGPGAAAPAVRGARRCSSALMLLVAARDRRPGGLADRADGYAGLGAAAADRAGRRRRGGCSAAPSCRTRSACTRSRPSR